MNYYRHLVQRLLEVYSVKVAPVGEEFTLASGEKSRVYIDVRKTAQKSVAHLPLASLLYDVLAGGDFGGISAVAGVVLGGCHLASILGLYASHFGRTQLDVVYVRKEPKGHGTKKVIEGPVVEPGTPVVLIEDVVTTGGSSIKAMTDLTDDGYDVRGTLSVIDRRATPSGTLNGKPFRSLFVLGDFVQTV